jgi:hypothetical protein
MKNLGIKTPLSLLFNNYVKSSLISLLNIIFYFKKNCLSLQVYKKLVLIKKNKKIKIYE